LVSHEHSAHTHTHTNIYIYIYIHMDKLHGHSNLSEISFNKGVH
jgi:hypothetical protein